MRRFRTLEDCARGSSRVAPRPDRGTRMREDCLLSSGATAFPWVSCRFQPCSSPSPLLNSPQCFQNSSRRLSRIGSSPPAFGRRFRCLRESSPDRSPRIWTFYSSCDTPSSHVPVLVFQGSLSHLEPSRQASRWWSAQETDPTLSGSVFPRFADSRRNRTRSS